MNAFSNYDQWKTASPHDEPTCIDLTDEFIRAYGRTGHGLCGKDADLDYGGQIRIIFFGVVDDYVVADFQPYASICGNDEWNEETWDLATEIMCGSDIPAEWDGDYWVAHEAKKTIKVPLGIADAEEIEKLNDLDPETIEKAYGDIFEACRPFQDEAASLAKALNELNND